MTAPAAPLVIDCDSHVLEPPWKPSEYLRRNVWYVAEPQERTIGALMDLVDETHILWGSDYPHIDSHIDAPKQIRASVAALPERRQRLVLGEIAARLFLVAQ